MLATALRIVISTTGPSTYPCCFQNDASARAEHAVYVRGGEFLLPEGFYPSAKQMGDFMNARRI